MKLPLKWLNDFVNVEDIEPKVLADKLLNVGFEVEEIIYTGDSIENVVVGKILDIKKHEESDHLKICMVDVGSEITTIVTGADNVCVGNLVPVAKDNSLLPGGKTITAAPLRNVMSYGMLCSGKELGIDNGVIDGAEINGILILPDSFEIGQDIKDALELNDYVLDISLTANRPDCQSIYGLAREVGAVLNRKVKEPNYKYKVVPSELKYVPQVRIDELALCPIYSGRIITDVKVDKSPKFIRDRLRLCGIRAINNIVDITNYVLLEIGQPLHAFDIVNIDRNIVVRKARKGENITALDGNKYDLNDNMLVISDEIKPLAIAGVMGGEYSGIKDDTQTVFLESAKFARGSIRYTSRNLGLRSDSSARFEKGVDFQSVEWGRERALSLISQLKVGKVLDLKLQSGVEIPKKKQIQTSAADISKLLGIDIKANVIAKILKSLSFDVEIKDGNIICDIPLFREDVDNYTDLAEEVIRYYGYDNIQSTLLNTARITVGGMSIRQKNINDIKQLMCAYGAYEALSYSFINYNQYDKLNIDKHDHLRNVISLKTPLSEELAVMRTQLTGSMLNSAFTNLKRKNDAFRLFEIARTYHAILPLTNLPKEFEVLCLAYYGKDESFYTIKDTIQGLLMTYGVEYKLEYSTKPYLHPGISADIIFNGSIIGSFGKIHPSVANNFSLPSDIYVAEICLENFIDGERKIVKYEPLPKFPKVDRDLALIVDESITVGEMVASIKKHGGDIVESAQMFDIYRGGQIDKDKKSVAFSIVLRSKIKTLDDNEIQAAMNSILNALIKDFNAKLR